MIMWWQFELVVNLVISVAYLAISTLIAVPLVRTHQLRTNKLALATAAIFFSCSVGHGLHALEHVFSIGQGDHASMTGSTGSWWLAV